MPHIEEHVRDLNEWIDRVEQVIVVDSESTDGTPEHIREHLRHSNVIYIDHPPGLYQSWNTAIRAGNCKYTYIATVNDRMPFDTLVRLHEEAERHEADVVVSAPQIVSDSGVVPKQWPIHRFTAVVQPVESYRLRPLELLVWNSIDLPGTLIGSSASNLYRTSVLQEQAFPCDYGHAGDSAWALLNSLNRKWIIVPDVKSTFWSHGGSNSSGSDGRALRAQLHRLAALQLNRLVESESPSSRDLQVADGLIRLSELRERREAAVIGYHACRKGRIPWVLLPKGWKLRAQKNRIGRELDQLLEALLRDTVTG